MPSPEREFQRIRQFRAAKPRDLSITGAVQSTADHASRAHRKLGELVEIWEQLVPADLAARTALSGVRAGVLHVIVDSSATAFELDRLMRSGALDQLRRRYRGTLLRVKTRIGDLS